MVKAVKDNMEVIKAMQDKALEENFDQIRELVTSLRSRAEKAEQRVAEWNKDDEIQKKDEEIKGRYHRISLGFNPSEEQWTEIRTWEDKHRERRHKEKEQEHTKMPSNPASFSYSFGNTHFGTMGSVICETCLRRAINMSHGDNKEFDRIKKELDAEWFFGEI